MNLRNFLEEKTDVKTSTPEKNNIIKTITNKNSFEDLTGQELEYLWNITDPDTGFKYDIPLLDTLSPDYKMNYIQNMFFKIKNPIAFEKSLSWD